jgi:tetratricopeptide (TPR) repeat protein
VIKPALVGLTGPWISGGIEFNWPQHHRPGTFDPVDSVIEEHEDGSITVWCSEIERMSRTKGMAGFRLYPGKAYLEINVKLYNRTPQAQSFLWWANPAVHVNDHYQSVFPPDVHAVFDHGKRDVSGFPIATGTYYKVDYSSGVDISRYKNIPVPTSYMAIASQYNFVGGYENDSQAGLLHVANHHVSPGKKQWTWGNSDFGKAWDRNLTDADGPYIELMCGVFTDNQPDFSWIMPYEEKSFSQYFMPYRDLGVVKNASKDALVNVEVTGNKVTIKAYATGEYADSLVRLTQNTTVIFEETVDLSPEQSYKKDIVLDDAVAKEDLSVSVLTKSGKTLVSWKPEKNDEKPLPEKAKPAKEPHEIESIEQLYLTGLHLEQYRHATYHPVDYYLEALNREPGDVRNNNAMGLWFLRKGQFVKAEPYFKAAIQTLTERNPNPYDGEPYFNLGVSLQYQLRHDEAYAAFYKSIWNAAWQEAGYFHLAQLASAKGDFNDALDLVSRSLIRNGHHHKARHLKVSVLRKLGNNGKAMNLINESLELDRFNFGMLYEKYLLVQDVDSLSLMKELMRGNIHSYIEIALDYASAGLFAEAASLLETCLENPDRAYPMAYYFLGWFAKQRGELVLAKKYAYKAECMDPSYCFPNRLEEIQALQCAIEVNPTGAKASYYLGNFWYGNRQYPEAISCWERSANLDEPFPTVHRNLALAYFNKLKNKEKALKELEKAFALDTTDSRIFMELDQLYKKLGKSPAERLTFLETYPLSVVDRDDVYLERVTLYNLLGNHEKALDLLLNRNFHPWEGGEGKVTGQYLYAHTELAKQAFRNHQFTEALDHLNATETYPHNLGEGKLYGAQEKDIFYWKGCVYEGLGDTRNATVCWEKASAGQLQPSAAMFYNDQQPDQIFYQGLALLKLNRHTQANDLFSGLVRYGENQLSEKVKIDYFAVSLPDLLIWEEDLQKRNMVHCRYLIGLGYLGLRRIDEAIKCFDAVLEEDLNHSGARTHLKMTKD